MPGTVLETAKDTTLVLATTGAVVAKEAEILSYLPHIALVVTIALMTGRLLKVILEIWDWFKRRSET